MSCQVLRIECDVFVMHSVNLFTKFVYNVNKVNKPLMFTLCKTLLYQLSYEGRRNDQADLGYLWQFQVVNCLPVQIQMIDIYCSINSVLQK